MAGAQCWSVNRLIRQPGRQAIVRPRKEGPLASASAAWRPGEGGAGPPEGNQAGGIRVASDDAIVVGLEADPGRPGQPAAAGAGRPGQGNLPGKPWLGGHDSAGG